VAEWKEAALRKTGRYSVEFEKPPARGVLTFARISLTADDGHRNTWTRVNFGQDNRFPPGDRFLRIEGPAVYQLFRKVNSQAVKVLALGSIAADKGPITFRNVTFDTSFLESAKGDVKLDDIGLTNLKEVITLRGVFQMKPKYHADFCMLVAQKAYTRVAIPPHLFKEFDQNVYADAVLRLKDDSVCHVQHSYRKDDGLTIRVVRDGAMIYIRPNKPSEATR
jgi:hypothetical protein